MIRVPAGTSPAVQRLMRAVAARGHAMETVPPAEAGHAEATVVGVPLADRAATDRMVESLERQGARRILILSRIGVHRDAGVAALRELWDLEERLRAAGPPVLTLRIAPLLGPTSPLWLQLSGRPALPRGGRTLINPVGEADVVETLDRALTGRAAWEGWYEVAGPEPWSLAELAALAGEWPVSAPGAGAWEPPLEEMFEHRLAEAAPWLEHFGIEPAPIAEAARNWSGGPAKLGVR